MAHTWQLPDRVLTLGLRPLVMGIVNVTPDSFADGGQFAAAEAACTHALELAEQGADILDIGGESTRPGAAPVSADEELRRVIPVVQALAGRLTIPLSIDTSKAAVAQAGFDAGASIVNDVTALTGDGAMPEVVRRARAGVILMHMQGTPATMQQAPHYRDVCQEIATFLAERLQAAEAAGIAPEQVVLDPGIGFGKTLAHNLEILARLPHLQQLGRPVCLGVSRKGFIGQVLGNRPVTERLAGSLAALLFAHVHNAVQIVRVHDVAATRDALAIFAAIARHIE